jgi:hypothetical protein
MGRAVEVSEFLSAGFAENSFPSTLLRETKWSGKGLYKSFCFYNIFLMTDKKKFDLTTQEARYVLEFLQCYPQWNDGYNDSPADVADRQRNFCSDKQAVKTAARDLSAYLEQADLIAFGKLLLNKDNYKNYKDVLAHLEAVFG